MMLLPDPPAIALVRQLLTAEEIEGRRSVWATARNVGLGTRRYACSATNAHGTWATVRWNGLSVTASGLASLEVAVHVLAAALRAAEVA